MPNLTIIRASVTTQKSIAAQIGSRIPAVCIARRVLPVLRVPLVQGVRLAPKEFPASEVRLDHKARRA